MSFESFVDAPAPKAKKKAAKSDERGCDFCPLNKVPGIKKIMGTVEGKDILVVAQSPGPQENDEGIELIGPSGKWWWDELERVGVKREHCDVFNVVRCFPADVIEDSYNSHFKMRNPTPQEIKCCSIHTERAVEGIKATQILVLGQIAAKALLNTRSLPQQKIFYDDRLKAKVYLLDHPAFFIRGYASPERKKAFREMLDIFAQDREDNSDWNSVDPYAFLKEQDYQLVQTEDEALEAERVIRQYAKKRRVAVDIEDAEFKGRRRVFACGFCPAPGMSFVFVFRHGDKINVKVEAVAERMLNDPGIRKVMQYGCSDALKLFDLEGIEVAGFDHDTMLSEYLRFPGQKSYALDAIVERRFPEFSGYKTVITAEAIAAIPDVPTRIKNQPISGQYRWLVENQRIDYSKLSLETLRLYNGGDCDITKVIEVDNKKHVSQPLMQLYVDLSFILYRMEANGPWFDYEQNAKLAEIYPRREAKMLAEIRQMVGSADFNPASPIQVFDAVYKKFKLKYPLKKGKPNTQKKTMLMLSREHPFPKKQIEWRATSKALSTYVVSYKKCADLNDGRLRTNWRLTGTRTGRLSSGRGKQHKDGSRINLQNIHKDSQMQNQCVSDPRWRMLYDHLVIRLRVFPAVTAFFAQHDAWQRIPKKQRGEDYKKLEPKMAPEVEADFKRLAHEAEVWIRKNLSDLKVFLILDYGQVEVRVFAQMSGDKNLKQDCMESDIHTRVGVTMTGWKPEMIAKDKKTRTLTKNVHFGILFLITKANLYDFVVAMTDPEDQDTISRERLEEAYDRYFLRYPGAKRFQDSQVEFAEKHGYVETMFGMRQPIVVRDRWSDDEEGGDEDDGDREVSWKAQSVNGPVQGTAHQLLECGLVNIHRKPKRYSILGTPVLDVHDNLTFAVNIIDIHGAAERARYLMEKESLATAKANFPGFKWDVPIVTEVEVGLSLGCKLDYDESRTLGEFALDWYRKRRFQMDDLDAELEAAMR